MGTEEKKSRLFVIMKTSIIAIAVNTLLAIFKVIVGVVSKSIAIILDGINNLSDAGSSFITILGTSLAAKPADKKHPFGYGRMEYISSLIVSAIVLYAGITSAVEALKKIIRPEEAEYELVTLIIVAVAIVIKAGLAFYMQAKGKETNSDSLVASGKEAILDVVVSIATLVAAIVYVTFGLALEAYLGLIISLIIIKTGAELLRETISKILGEPAEVKTAIEVKNTIKSFEDVYGAYDLVMNNYGPDYYTASVHIEVSDSMTAVRLDKLARDISDEVLKKHGVYLTAIGIYAKNTSNEKISEIEKAVKELLLKKEHVLAVHGFYINLEKMQMRFDAVISLEAKDRTAVYNEAVKAVKESYPDFDISVGFDMDYNEIEV